MIDKKKLLLTLIVFTGLFGLVISKAFYVQVINRGKLIAYANSQFVRKVKVYPPRGSILDRNGGPLAINVPTYNLFTIPKLNLKNKSIYKELSQIVPELTLKKIQEKIKNRKNYTTLARGLKLSTSQASKIKDLEGIYFDKEYTRYYPNHELLSQTLGFVGNENIGLAGLELKFEKELKGDPVELKFYRDAKGRPIKYENSDLETKAPDIYLSIDKDLQDQVETILKTGVLEAKARRGGVGIMDASSGEILAMANYPSFDPNNAKIVDPSLRRLPFITDPFEPGSVFKTLVVASALENKVSTPNSKYYCEKGKFKIGKHTISEAEAHEKFEWLTVEDILKFSSNIGTTKIAFDLTYPKLKNSLIKFGVGEKTGIEIPGESKGIINRHDKISQISLSNISFGHGVAVTGIQLLSIYSAIANDGVMINPTILKRKDGEKIEAKRILETKTARQLETILTKAVEQGTGTNALIPFFRIAGKTGTAQRVREGGGYDGYISSFIGYPVNLDKKFVIFVYVDDPRGGVYYGNAIAAPIFKKIAQYILYKNKDFKSIADSSEHKSEHKDEHKAPMKKVALTPGKTDKVTITHSVARDFNGKTMPSFIGLDKSTALKLASEMNLKVQTNGFGVVSSQSLESGSLIEEDAIVTLKFTPPEYE